MANYWNTDEELREYLKELEEYYKPRVKFEEFCNQIEEKIKQECSDVNKNVLVRDWLVGMDKSVDYFEMDFDDDGRNYNLLEAIRGHLMKNVIGESMVITILDFMTYMRKLKFKHELHSKSEFYFIELLVIHSYEYCAPFKREDVESSLSSDFSLCSLK